MKITSFTDIKVNPSFASYSRPELVQGIALEHPAYVVDLSIDASARQLPCDVIELELAKYFGSVEINSTLTRILGDKSSEVSKSAYMIISFNFFARWNSGKQS